MILKLALSTLTLGLLTATPAFAHSEYWECAAASGSNEAAAANCGSRADYDRTGNLGGSSAPSQSDLDNQRREQERQQQEEQRRRDDDRRNDDIRRDDENRRRENDRLDEEARRRRDEESSRNDSYTPSERTPARRTNRKPQRQAPVVVDEPTYAEDMVIPVEINQQVSSLNVGVAANLDAYVGYKIKAIKVETSTTGNSVVNVLVAGVRVGSIKAIQPGEYEKDFTSRTVIRASQKNLVLTTSGDVTILRVTLVIGK